MAELKEKLVLTEEDEELALVPEEDKLIFDLPTIEPEEVEEPSEEVVSNAYTNMLQDLLRKQWDVIEASESIIATLENDESVSFNKEDVLAIARGLIDETTKNIGMATKAIGVIDPSQEKLMQAGADKAEEVMTSEESETDAEVDDDSLKEEWQYCDCKDLDEVDKLDAFCSKNNCKISAKTSTNDGYKCRIEGPFDDVHKVRDKWSMFKWKETPLEEELRIVEDETESKDPFDKIREKYEELDYWQKFALDEIEFRVKDYGDDNFKFLSENLDKVTPEQIMDIVESVAAEINDSEYIWETINDYAADEYIPQLEELQEDLEAMNFVPLNVSGEGEE